MNAITSYKKSAFTFRKQVPLLQLVKLSGDTSISSFSIRLYQISSLDSSTIPIRKNSLRQEKTEEIYIVLIIEPY